ncbi:hypothetical protein [Pseudocolwellia agarivorans]|uniref:hypothetical protein n=1 Tax=Pseudocolwellia agarivorans TaxID=1911682 RepID=UPI0009855B86|nr:hypothetical protein [Pseudocolwellia agarivorans]
MKFFVLLNVALLYISTFTVLATDIKISDVISKEEFALYKDVGEFIDRSPKVTIIVQPELSDINEYGKGVVKSLTGTDCDRDGKMDDNATCNAVYVKLWLKYKR